MEVGKRTLAIGALFIAFAAVMATQYATVRLQSEMVITGTKPYIQLMAHDRDAMDGGWLIRRSSDTLTYRMNLGNITAGQVKIWTAAFAIVNTERNYKLRITGVRLFGTNLGNLLNHIQIVLHREPNKVGVAQGSYDPPNNAYWQEDLSAKVYWVNGQSVDHSSTGWVLGRGNGYTADGKLYYGTVGSWNKASYDTTYRVFNYTAGQNIDNNADENSDNFVWVQIVIDLSGVSDLQNLSVPLDQVLTIYIEFFMQGEAV